MKHKHQWQLVRTYYDSFISGREVAVFVCPCGILKRIKLTEKKNDIEM